MLKRFTAHTTHDAQVLTTTSEVKTRMVLETIRKHKRTNIFIIDQELWAWAQYRAKTLGYESVSGYIFDLVEKDKDQNILSGKKTR